MLRRRRARMARESRAHSAAFSGSWRWYRAGYLAALDDIDRTGLIPNTEKTRREAAARALNRWVDEPLVVGDGQEGEVTDA